VGAERVEFLEQKWDVHAGSQALWSASQNIAASRIAASVPQKPTQNQGELEARPRIRTRSLRVPIHAEKRPRPGIRMDPNILMRVS